MSDEHPTESASAGTRHVLVVVDAAAAPRFDWPAARRRAEADGKYVGLIAIDGPEARWIVPTALASLISQTIGPIGAIAAAVPGAADSVVDRLFEATALLPDVTVTEVRIHGGKDVESDLVRAVDGSSIVALRVHDRGRYRPARIWPARRSHIAHGATTSATSQIGSAAGAPAGPPTTTRPPVPVSPSLPTPGPASPSRTSAVAPARAGAGRPPLALARRVVSGVLAALVVDIAVFAGWVLTHIWQYSGSAITSVVDDVVSVQSHGFALSLLVGLAVSVAGSRARWIPTIGLALGALAGSAPGLDPIHVAAPGFLTATWRNIADFAGLGMAWLAVLGVPAAIVLAVATTRAIPPLPRAAVDARARRRSAVKAALGTRSPVDRWALRTFFTLTFTLVTPWLLGRFVLQDNFLFRTGTGVFDPGARGFWLYVVPLLLGGLLLLAGALALALIAQPWTGRVGHAVLGLIVAVALVPLGGVAKSSWSTAEAPTANALVTTSYPFSDHYSTCGSADIGIWKGNTLVRWQVYTAQRRGTTGTACNRLEIYRGWEPYGTIDLTPGQTVSAAPVLWGGKTLDYTGLKYTRDDGRTVQLSLAEAIEKARTH